MAAAVSPIYPSERYAAFPSKASSRRPSVNEATPFVDATRCRRHHRGFRARARPSRPCAFRNRRLLRPRLDRPRLGSVLGRPCPLPAWTAFVRARGRRHHEYRADESRAHNHKASESPRHRRAFRYLNIDEGSLPCSATHGTRGRLARSKAWYHDGTAARTASATSTPTSTATPGVSAVE